MAETLYLGIDGGGTKTEAVLVDAYGHILSRVLAGSSNPNDIGLDKSVDLLVSLIRQLIGETHAEPENVSLFAGVSGVINLRDRMIPMIHDSISVGHIDVQSDGINLLSAELPEGDGACIICGTGSACFLRMGKELVRIGGWGYLLDSGGSGYDMGRQAIEAVLRAHDKRGVPTLLTELITDALGAPAESSITKLYTEGKPLIASMAPLVFKAAAEGDEIAVCILQRNARSLAEYIGAAWKWLTDSGRHPSSLPVVLGGSISQRNRPFWADLVASFVDPDVPAVVTTAHNPVIWGPVCEAVRIAGGHADHDVMLSVFKQDYARLGGRLPTAD
ncbi:MAG: hypothetical protein MJ192_07485 [Clostridia bacterium]|nr:hypothetical protein [Clostridia bacterium]